VAAEPGDCFGLPAQSSSAIVRKALSARSYYGCVDQQEPADWPGGCPAWMVARAWSRLSCGTREPVAPMGRPGQWSGLDLRPVVWSENPKQLIEGGTRRSRFCLVSSFGAIGASRQARSMRSGECGSAADRDVGPAPEPKIREDLAVVSVPTDTGRCAPAPRDRAASTAPAGRQALDVP
jgi:hypothetical protein